jgi:Family of unknown function (DUF5715)
MKGLVRGICSVAVLGGLTGIWACGKADSEHQWVEAGITGDPTRTTVVQPVGNYSLPPAAVANGMAWQQVQAEVVIRIDSANRKLLRVPALSRHERGELRHDVSAVQIEPARRLGIQPGTPLQQLVSSGQVVQLPEATSLWVLRDLNFSVPYLVPSAEALLEEIAHRFHARLDSLGLPRFRLEITSGLRTAGSQAALRRRNRNAAPDESAHEYGTTFDIAYRKFAPPMDDGTGRDPLPLSPLARIVSDSLWMLTARQRGVELQAVLGRVLQEMRLEGKLLTRMERSQPVYHTTVARLYPTPGAKNAQP